MFSLAEYWNVFVGCHHSVKAAMPRLSAVLKLRDVLELWQRDPQTKFSCYVGQRITSRFTGQSRAP